MCWALAASIVGPEGVCTSLPLREITARSWEFHHLALQSRGFAMHLTPIQGDNLCLMTVPTTAVACPSPVLPSNLLARVVAFQGWGWTPGWCVGCGGGTSRGHVASWWMWQTPGHHGPRHSSHQLGLPKPNLGLPGGASLPSASVRMRNFPAGKRKLQLRFLSWWWYSVSWDFRQILTPMAWITLQVLWMGHFFCVFAALGVESCTAAVSRGTSSKGDKAGRGADKSYMEKQKQQDPPVEGQGGALGPILCSLK